jgi:hypothetical protein
VVSREKFRYFELQLHRVGCLSDRCLVGAAPAPLLATSAPQAYTLDAYAAAYGTLGYTPCSSGGHELGFEKIVIFTDPTGFPTHAARQLGNGNWTSKLGYYVDIEHTTPEALNGPNHGAPALFMRRPRPAWRCPLALLRRVLAVVQHWYRGML